MDPFPFSPSLVSAFPSNVQWEYISSCWEFLLRGLSILPKWATRLSRVGWWARFSLLVTCLGTVSISYSRCWQCSSSIRQGNVQLKNSVIWMLCILASGIRLFSHCFFFPSFLSPSFWLPFLIFVCLSLSFPCHFSIFLSSLPPLFSAACEHTHTHQWNYMLMCAFRFEIQTFRLCDSLSHG